MPTQGVLATHEDDATHLLHCAKLLLFGLGLWMRLLLKGFHDIVKCFSIFPRGLQKHQPIASRGITHPHDFSSSSESEALKREIHPCFFIGFQIAITIDE